MLEVEIELSAVFMWDDGRCKEMKDFILPRLIDYFKGANAPAKVGVLHVITHKFLPHFTSENFDQFQPLLFEVSDLLKNYLIFAGKLIELNENFETDTDEINSACMSARTAMMDVVKFLQDINMIFLTGKHITLYIDWALSVVINEFEFYEETFASKVCMPKKLLNCFFFLHEQIVDALNCQEETCNFRKSSINHLICLKLQHLLCLFRKDLFISYLLTWQVYIKLISIKPKALKCYFASTKNGQLFYLCIYTICYIRNSQKSVTKTLDVKFWGCKLNFITSSLKTIAAICRRLSFTSFSKGCLNALFNLVLESMCICIHVLTKGLLFSEGSLFAELQDLLKVIRVVIACFQNNIVFNEFLLEPIRSGLTMEEKITYVYLKVISIQLEFEDLKKQLKNPSTKEEAISSDTHCINCLPYISRLMSDIISYGPSILSAYADIIAEDSDSFYRPVTLYECILTTFCAYATICCSHHFEMIEKMFINALFDDCSPSTCLASDILYFYCRCSSRLIMNYMQIFETWTHCLPVSVFLTANDLIKRLWRIIYLDEEKSVLLTKNCPIIYANNCSGFDKIGKPLDSHFFCFFSSHIDETRSKPLALYVSKLQAWYSMFEEKNNENLEATQIKAVVYLIEFAFNVLHKYWFDPALTLSTLKFLLHLPTRREVIQIEILNFLCLWLQVNTLTSEEMASNVADIIIVAMTHNNIIMQRIAFSTFRSFAAQAPQKAVIVEIMKKFENADMLVGIIKEKQTFDANMYSDIVLAQFKQELQPKLHESQCSSKSIFEVPKNIYHGSSVKLADIIV